MRRSTSDWEEELDSRPVVTTLKFWFLTIGVLVGTGLLVTVVLWGTGVWAAPWKGKGDAHQQKYSSSNWVSAQQGFHQKFNTVQAFRTQLKTARAELADFDKQHPNVGNGTPYDPLLKHADQPADDGDRPVAAVPDHGAVVQHGRAVVPHGGVP